MRVLAAAVQVSGRRIPPIAMSLMLAAACGACAAAPARIANPGPLVTALPDPCSLISFGMAHRLVPGLSRGDISHDGHPDTGHNQIPSNTECIWGNDPVTAPEARSILIALQSFSGDNAATGSYQAHQYVMLDRAARARPVGGLGNEAWMVYYTQPDHMSYAKVMFRWGNQVADIEYSGLDRAGTTRTPIGKDAATSVALALAREVFMRQPRAA
jgi:hypothetical protein